MLVGQPQIRQQLLLVHSSENLDRLHFDDDLVFDNEIGPESGVDDSCSVVALDPAHSRGAGEVGSHL